MIDDTNKPASFLDDKKPTPFQDDPKKDETKK